MAEQVNYYMESMIPELKDFERLGIFTNAEIKSIVKKRSNFEYALKRRIVKKIDYLRYIEYEMTLESLRVKRKERLGLTNQPASVSDGSCTRHIHHIFNRACRKFYGDVELWLDFVGFAKRAGSSRAVGSIFARAMQFHPHEERLWVMAAEWEWECNGNISAARAILQRGLRFNGDLSESMWLAYFNLELQFLVKILHRRSVLGINNGPESVDTAAEATIDLNQLPGAGEDDDIKVGVSSIGDVQPIAGENDNGFFEGAIPLAVYRNAIKQLPRANLKWRQQFLHSTTPLLAECPSLKPAVERLRAEFYASVAQDFPQLSAAESLLAERFTDSYFSSTPVLDAEFPANLRKSIEAYEQLFLSNESGKDQAELYVQYLERMQQLVAYQHQQTANEGLIVLKQFLTDAINSVVSRSFAKGWLSVDRTVAFITIGGNDSLETLRSAVTIHPASPELHDLYMNAVSASADYKKQQAYEWLLGLLERNCKSVFLYTRTFERYRDVLLLNGEEFNAINAKYQSTIAHWDAIGSVNDDLSAPIVQSYLNWLVNRIGVEASRPYYNRLAQLKLRSKHFFEYILQFEASTEKRRAAVLRSVYELASRSLPNDPQIWLAYIRFEMNEMKDHAKALAIYQRVIKSSEKEISIDCKNEFSRLYGEQK